MSGHSGHSGAVKYLAELGVAAASETPPPLPPALPFLLGAHAATRNYKVGLDTNLPAHASMYRSIVHAPAAIAARFTLHYSSKARVCADGDTAVEGEPALEYLCYLLRVETEKAAPAGRILYDYARDNAEQRYLAEMIALAPASIRDRFNVRSYNTISWTVEAVLLSTYLADAVAEYAAAAEHAEYTFFYNPTSVLDMQCVVAIRAMPPPVAVKFAVAVREGGWSCMLRSNVDGCLVHSITPRDTLRSLLNDTYERLFGIFQKNAAYDMEVSYDPSNAAVKAALHAFGSNSSVKNYRYLVRSGSKYITTLWMRDGGMWYGDSAVLDKLAAISSAPGPAAAASAAAPADTPPAAAAAAATPAADVQGPVVAAAPPAAVDAACYRLPVSCFLAARKRLVTCKTLCRLYVRKSERAAFMEQLDRMPAGFSDCLVVLFQEYEDIDTDCVMLGPSMPYLLSNDPTKAEVMQLLTWREQ